MYQNCPICKKTGIFKKEVCPVCLGERIINKETGSPPSKYIAPWNIPYIPVSPSIPYYPYPSYPITYIGGTEIPQILSGTITTTDIAMSTASTKQYPSTFTIN
jgi:hypothetical protein